MTEIRQSRVIRQNTIGGVSFTLERAALGQVADYTARRDSEIIGIEDDKKAGLRLYNKTLKEALKS